MDNSVRQILEGSHRKLEEEKEKEIRGICKIRMKVKNLKKDPNKGPRGKNQQRQRRTIEKYKKQCMEREGKIIGLERAIDFIDQAGPVYGKTLKLEETAETEANPQTPPREPKPSQYNPQPAGQAYERTKKRGMPPEQKQTGRHPRGN